MEACWIKNPRICEMICTGWNRKHISITALWVFFHYIYRFWWTIFLLINSLLLLWTISLYVSHFSKLAPLCVLLLPGFRWRFIITWCISRLMFPTLIITIDYKPFTMRTLITSFLPLTKPNREPVTSSNSIIFFYIKVVTKLSYVAEASRVFDNINALSSSLNFTSVRFRSLIM